MYVIYNNDGSIRATNFTEFINKGNNNENYIFVTFPDKDVNDYSAYALFKLPNGQATVIIGDKETVEINSVSYEGWKILLTQDVTCYAGLVYCSIKVTDNAETNPQVLYTYPVILTINDTHIAPEDLTLANLAQYNNLLQYFNADMNTLNGKIQDLLEEVNALEEDLQENKLYKHSIIFYESIYKNKTLVFISKSPQQINTFDLFYSFYNSGKEFNGSLNNLYAFAFVYSQDNTVLQKIVISNLNIYYDSVTSQTIQNLTTDEFDKDTCTITDTVTEL